MPYDEGLAEKLRDYFQSRLDVPREENVWRSLLYGFKSHVIRYRKR